MEKTLNLTHNNFSAQDISKMIETSPLLICGANENMFSDAIKIDSNISSSELGIVQLQNELKKPSWLLKLEKENSKILLINDIDGIDKYEQQKFIEILKYKTVSGKALPQKTAIIVLCKNLDKVSSDILSLCQIIK